MKKALLIIGILAILIGGYFWTTYNSLVSANETVDNQWAQVESQYQRRFDLIPNLVNSVKGAMEQEQEVFNNIAEARTRYAGANTVNEKAEAATEVESALSRLLVIMENYPQLKSIDTVQTLMAQLEGTENRISVERKRYNDTVQKFNVKVKRFPTNIVAGMLGYSEKTYFEAVAGAEQAPTVEF
ncbi:LemA family protein [Candidatus Peregrinibacteria bacterium RIFOXYC2_FULL_33_13]|nr:MAG: LemA protein [Candidatus Peregrinibacteria bacterium GW2011_GWA2_33_10]KKP40860.1 MAG: lema protein, LemA protein [Candidatus Peregrinibacteria bacterium GW2011_GWC2_33_13]OGJ48558.1 MAG: LemA family protein [Candidatus Peregrinibacteria bacterium RIFOXYA2_FULL_33_7]OGJ53472.1 MAG: LemA family protein [Candidatus Peregrinibacteria bacterium RIFOXYC2_FULL_33_13]